MYNNGPITSSSSSGGIGFCGLLAVVFITLKLLGYITWSWWWVLAPVWIPAIVVLIIFACIITYLIALSNSRD